MADTTDTHNCASCSKPGATAKCSRCLSAYYCNKECQKAAWKTHKPICLRAAAGAQQRPNELYIDFSVNIAHGSDCMVFSLGEDLEAQLPRLTQVLVEGPVKTTIQTEPDFAPGEINGFRSLMEKNGQPGSDIEWIDGLHHFLVENIRERCLRPKVQDLADLYGLRYEVSFVSDNKYPRGVYETPHQLFPTKDMIAWYGAGHQLYICYIPLEENGTWKATYAQIKEGECTEPSTLTFIPFGNMLLIPASMTVSGGLMTSPTGNPHLELIVYALKGGSPASIPTLGKHYLKVDSERNEDGTFATYGPNSRWNTETLREFRDNFQLSAIF